MFPLLYRSRQLKSRHRPAFDLLESRIALAVGGDPGATGTVAPLDGTTAEVGNQMPEAPLSVDLIDPVPDSVSIASPTSLLLKFNRPILSWSLSSDVLIVQTGSDGEPLWYSQPDQLTLDESATLLTVPVPQTLAPGHYQVFIVGSSQILDIDGNYLITDPNLDNLLLGQFDVAGRGVTLGNAYPLGKLGSTPMEVRGSLDFQTNPYAVDLYRIQLDPGHFWRLGLEVTAERDRGTLDDSKTLDSALGLFDDQGRLIASDELGRTGAPKDPYLFAGLQPGTYYVGVSGVGNLPGTRKGYNPATGSAGAVRQTQDGGPFTLHVVADPVDTPPTVLGLTLDHADPANSAPTGLTLAFSRAIAVTSQFGDREPSLSKTIEVVDQAGQNWPVQVSYYSETDAKISYLFDNALPAGHYLVRLPEQEGLTDLAGLSPVAAGQPPGVLGQFDVAAREGEPNPLDLGALLPAAATAGVPIDVILSQGQSITYRVVVTVPGQYILQEESSGDPPSVQITGPALDRPLLPTGTNDTLLSPGVYLIRFEAPTGGPVHVHLFFRLSSDQTEIVLANGVGQGPALPLRLITYSEGTVTPPPVAILILDLGPPVAILILDLKPLPTPLPAPIPKGTTDSLSFLSMGSDLVGRPSVAAIGSKTSQREVVLGTDPGSIHGVVPGQSLKALPLGPARFFWESASSTGGGLEDPGARPPARATMIDFDLRGAIATAVGLRRWAIQQGEYFLSWAGSWSRERPTSEATSIRVTGLIPGQGPRQSGIGSEPDQEVSADQPDRANAWTKLLSPPVVVISVAAIAQVCWHYVQWWKSRRHSEQGRAAKIPTPSMTWDRLSVFLLTGSHRRAG